MSNTVFSQGELGDFFELRHGFAFPGSAFSDEGELLVVKIKNIKPGRLDLSKQEFIPADYLATHGGYMPKAGDLLVSLSGNRYEGNPETWVGKVCLYTGAPRCLINQRVGILRKKEGVEIDSRYFSYLLSTLDAQQSLIQIATSSGGQANLSTKQLLDFEVLVAPPTDQKAIAHILGTLDGKIELNRKTNETLEAMAKALFKSWFVDFDPVKAKAEGRPTGLPAEISDLFPDSFEDSVLGEIPSGWRVGSLDQIGINPRETAKPEEMDSSDRYIGLEHMPRGSICLGESGQAEELESNKNRFRQGDLLFGKLRPYFKKTGYCQFDGVCSTDIVVVRKKGEYGDGFICCLLASDPFIDFTVAASSGTRMPRTSWKDMCEFPFAIPSQSLLLQFDKQFCPTVRKVTSNCLNSASLAATRETLLPKLISGEIRIPDAEKMLEEVDV